MVNVTAEINIDLHLAKFRTKLRGVDISVFHEDTIHTTNGKLFMSDLAEILHEGAVVGNGAVIPPRRYLVDGVKRNIRAIRAVIRPIITAYVMEGIDNFEAAGEFIVETIKDFVRSGYYRDVVPNAESTIAKKGSDIPLVHTNEFLDSLTYEVKNASIDED